MSKKANRVLSLLTNQTGGKKMGNENNVPAWALSDRPTVQHLEINSDLALQLLIMNTNNRRLDKNRVARKRLDLEAGLMRPLCSNVIVSDTGVLLDGQHTLAAIAGSGKSLEVIFHAGRKETDWVALDCPSQRTVGQALGHLGIKNGNQIGTMARALMVWRATGYPLQCAGPAATESFRVSQSQVIGYAVEHEALLQAAATEGRRLNGMIGAVPRSYLGVLYVVLGDADESRRDEFLEQVFGGDSKSAMLRLLRTSLIRVAATPAARRPSPQVTHAMIIITWNAWLTGRELKVIRWQSSREDFPVVLKPSDLGV